MRTSFVGATCLSGYVALILAVREVIMGDLTVNVDRPLLADSCPMRQTQRNQEHGFAYDRAAGQSNA